MRHMFSGWHNTLHHDGLTTMTASAAVEGQGLASCSSDDSFSVRVQLGSSGNLVDENHLIVSVRVESDLTKWT